MMAVGEKSLLVWCAFFFFFHYGGFSIRKEISDFGVVGSSVRLLSKVIGEKSFLGQTVQ